MNKLFLFIVIRRTREEQRIIKTSSFLRAKVMRRLLSYRQLFMLRGVMNGYLLVIEQEFENIVHNILHSFMKAMERFNICVHCLTMYLLGITSYNATYQSLFYDRSMHPVISSSIGISDIGFVTTPLSHIILVCMNLLCGQYPLSLCFCHVERKIKANSLNVSVGEMRLVIKVCICIDLQICKTLRTITLDIVLYLPVLHLISGFPM